MRRLYRLLVAALERHRTVALEWYLALQTWTCGLWIGGQAWWQLRPWLAFAGFTAVLVGGVATYALAQGRYRQPRSQANLDICRRSMFAVAVLWAVITLLDGIGRPFGLLWPVLLWNVIAALWCYARLSLRFTPDAY
jgi:hypothetical protein